MIVVPFEKSGTIQQMTHFLYPGVINSLNTGFLGIDCLSSEIMQFADFLRL
jgi:hypothetical protein